MTVSFDTTPKDARLITKIAERAMIIAEATGDLWVKGQTATDFRMDLTAVHANGCPLRLDGLLAAPEYDFVHDISGIRRHLNRDTGQLEDCFLPRYHAQPAPRRMRRIK